MRFTIMKTKPTSFVMAFAITLMSCQTTARHETGFLDRTVVVNGTTYPYTVFVPRNFDRSRRWPVVLALHGAGERGNDGVRQMQIGAAAAIRSHPDRVPAIVVFPQAPADTRWIGEPADAAMLALDRTMAEFHGDPRRVYVTGLSMGGYGTYHLALAHPDRFAALAIVCGGLFPHPATTAVQRSPLIPNDGDPYAYVAHAIGNIPIRIFHGDADPVIPPDESRQMAEALKREGADVQYDEFPGVGHNAWDRAYGDPTLWTWLFAQSRK
jgi:predicted peptidase